VPHGPGFVFKPARGIIEHEAPDRLDPRTVKLGIKIGIQIGATLPPVEGLLPKLMESASCFEKVTDILCPTKN
jgi:hypothetical protein